MKAKDIVNRKSTNTTTGNEYSIYEYLREHRDITIFLISSLVAACSFIFCLLQHLLDLMELYWLKIPTGFLRNKDFYSLILRPFAHTLCVIAFILSLLFASVCLFELFLLIYIPSYIEQLNTVLKGEYNNTLSKAIESKDRNDKSDNYRFLVNKLLLLKQIRAHGYYKINKLNTLSKVMDYIFKFIVFFVFMYIPLILSISGFRIINFLSRASQNPGYILFLFVPVLFILVCIIVFFVFDYYFGNTDLFSSYEDISKHLNTIFSYISYKDYLEISDLPLSDATRTDDTINLKKGIPNRVFRLVYKAFPLIVIFIMVGMFFSSTPQSKGTDLLKIASINNKEYAVVYGCT